MIYIRGMKDCLQCSKPLVHVPGRKEKSFCDVNCRNKYFYSQRKKQIEDAKALLVSLPSDYVEIKKIGILANDGEAKPLTLPKPSKGAAKKEGLQSSVNSIEPGKEVYDAPQKDVIFKSVKEYDRLIPITNKTQDLNTLLTEILASSLPDSEKRSFEHRIKFKINWNEKT